MPNSVNLFLLLSISNFILTSPFILHPSSIILDLHVAGSNNDLWLPVTLAEYKFEPLSNSWIRSASSTLFTVGGECNLTASACFSRNSCKYQIQGQASLSNDGKRLIFIGDKVSTIWPFSQKITSTRLITEIDPTGKSITKEWDGCNTNIENQDYTCPNYPYRRPLGAIKLGKILSNSSFKSQGDNGYIVSCGPSYSGTSRSGASLLYLQSNDTHINSSLILRNFLLQSTVVNSGMILTSAFSTLNITQLIVPVFDADSSAEVPPNTLGAYLVGSDYNTSIDTTLYQNTTFKYLQGTDTMVSFEANTVAVFVENATSIYLCLNNPENQTPSRAGVVGMKRSGEPPITDYTWSVQSFYDLHGEKLESCGSLTGRLESGHLILYATSCVKSANCLSSVWALNTTDLTSKEIIKVNPQIFINSVILPPCDPNLPGSYSCPTLVNGLWSIDTIIQPSATPSPSLTPSPSVTSSKSQTASTSASSTCSTTPSPSNTLIVIPSSSPTQQSNANGGSGDANIQTISLNIGIVVGSVLGIIAFMVILMVSFKTTIDRLFALCTCCRGCKSGGGRKAILRKARDAEWNEASPRGLRPIRPSLAKGQSNNKTTTTNSTSINPLEQQSRLAQARSYRASQNSSNSSVQRV